MVICHVNYNFIVICNTDFANFVEFKECDLQNIYQLLIRKIALLERGLVTDNTLFSSIKKNELSFFFQRLLYSRTRFNGVEKTKNIRPYCNINF
jgi:hypothetical protein